MNDNGLNQEQTGRLDAVSQAIHSLLAGYEPAQLAVETQPQDEIRQVTEFVNRIITDSLSHARIIDDLSKGRLDTLISSRSHSAQVLKAFQATFKHLVWQTRQVADGDYSQRVDFLGEFSESFNTMVTRLDENQKAIERQLAELERLATIDSLTGLRNRRSFTMMASQELKRWMRYQMVFTLLMFDLDHFKKVNDTFGHDAGDEVLKSVAKVCQRELRDTDIVARIGGEEFEIGRAHV